MSGLPGLPVAATFTVVDGVLLVVVVVLLGVSALLALAETSLVRTSRAKAKALVDDGRRGAKVLLRLTENPQGFLNPVLLMVLICQLVVATLVGILAADWFGAWGVLAATVFEIVVIFVLAEAVPKNWAVHHPERAALFSAPLVSAIVRFWPVRVISGALIGLANLLIGEKGQYLGSDVTESELLAMADVALEGDVIETEERALIHSIIEFGDTVVREVMVPRPDMVTIGADEAVEAALERALEVGFSRMPAVEQQVDDVVGIAYTKDLIRAVRQGHGAERGPRPTSGRPTSSPRPSGSPTSCARCRPTSSTWRWWSTSTAAPPAWSPWRTSSRSWWARSSTSSTSRRPPSSAWSRGSCGSAPGCPWTRSTS